MFDVGSILPALLENFARLSPIRAMIIHEYERGVMFSYGRFRKVLPPGLHWYWNWWQSICDLVTVTQCVESQRLVVTTRDHKSIVVSVAVQYSIDNPAAYYLKVQDFDKSFLNMVEGECSRVAATKESDEILTDPAAFGKTIAEYAGRVSSAWGCHIEAVSLPNLAATRVFRLVGDASPDRKT